MTAIRVPVVMSFALMLFVVVAALSTGPARATEWTAGFETGKPAIQSMSALEFGPDGVLFIGDSRGGAVYAIDTGDRKPGEVEERFTVPDIETKVAALLGTTADQVLIHDLAVNPISHVAYLAVSRGRTGWDSKWTLPNDLADAVILLRVHPDATIDELKLDEVAYGKVELPDPIDLDKTHRFKEGLSQRVDAITDVVFDDGMLFVSGLSNEEFSAAIWQVEFPFTATPMMATVEIFHGAHGKWETASPIRTFLPYDLDGESHILASYLCTPLVTFPVKALTADGHLKGRTVAEFGSGNYPLDMVLARHGEKEFIVMANSMLPLMTYSTDDVQAFNRKPGITRESPTYAEGVGYVPRAGSGIQQLDNFDDDSLLALQRMPSGKLDLVALSVARLAY